MTSISLNPVSSSKAPSPLNQGAILSPRLPRIPLNPIKALSVLSLRGASLVLLVYYFATQLTLGQNDILAAVLASSLGLIIFTILLITVIWGWYLRSTLFISSLEAASNDPLKISSSPLTLTTSVEAQVSTILTLSMTRPLIPPFYSFKAEILLYDDLQPVLSIVKSLTEISPKDFSTSDSSFGSSATAIFNLKFPHRGQWKMQRVKFELSDKFGLTKINWSLSETNITNQNELQVTVDPANPIRENANLPIIASRDREGDTLNQSRSRLGEPFDLKRYNPSDGLKKVVWKVFARSGELISRHPESAMTPEGECYIFVIASPDAVGDQVARDALDYCSCLMEAGVELRLGCAGSTPSQTASTDAEALELLRRSSWMTEDSQKHKTPNRIASVIKYLLMKRKPINPLYSPRPTQTGLAGVAEAQTITPPRSSLSKLLSSFISAQPNNPPIRRLVVFLAPQNQIEEQQMIEALIELENQNISPVVMLPTNRPTTRSKATPLAQPPGPLEGLIHDWFFGAASVISTEGDNVSSGHLLQIASQRGWDVHLHNN